MYVFGTYGTPVDIHLMGGKSTSGQCCAFVTYDSRGAADTAIASLDGVYSMRDDGSAPIRVSWARPSSTSTSGPSRPPAQATPRYPTQPARGGGASVSTYRHSQGASGGPGSGMGSPHTRASGGGYGRPSYGGTGYSGQGYGGSSYGTGTPAGGRTQRSTKLFVGNLPPDISQEALRMVFGHYGTVTDIHVMVGKSRSGQACAFVEYAAPLEAETAVLTLHEQYEIRPGDGTIMVKFASPQGSRGAPY